MADPGRSPLRRLLSELRRRRVGRAVGAYAVVGWLVIQVASDVFPALALPEWTVTLVVVLILLGLPVAVVLAWAYDLTPAGVVRAEEAAVRAGSEPLSGPLPTRPAVASAKSFGYSSRIAVAGAVAVLALAGGAFVMSRDDASGVGDRAGAGAAADDAASRTVVVLPFQVRGSDHLAYLADGIVDVLSTDLDRTGALTAIDPNQLLAAVAAGTPQPVDPDRARELAARFGAGLYILGNVFEVDGRVRLTASLYERSRGGRPVSTQTVEGAVSDVLALASRLAAQLAGAVPIRGSGPGARLVWAGDTVDALGTPSADGRWLSYTDWFSGNLAVRDLTANVGRHVTRKGDWETSDAFAEYSAIAPDGRRIAYAWFNERYEYELRVIDADGTGDRLMLPADSAWLWPHGWSPDGSAVFVSYWNDDAGHLLRVTVATAAVDTIRRLERGIGAIRISPDGRWLAYGLGAPDDARQQDIHVAAVDGSTETTVVRSPANDVILDWLPDGRHLLFLSDRGEGFAIWSLPIVNGRAAREPVLVRPRTGWLQPIGFAGDDFLYSVYVSERQVHTARFDLERARVIEDAAPAAHAAAGTSSSPAWAPDGQRIAYVAQRPGAPPLTASVAVRDVANGALTEYPVLLNSPSVTQWLTADMILLTGRSPEHGRGHFTLDLHTGALGAYATGQQSADNADRWLTVGRDGRTQYFYRWIRNAAVYIRRDAATGSETVLFRSDGSGGPLAVSPDERRIAFSMYSRDRGRVEIYVADTDGSSPRVVHAWTSGPELSVSALKWSRDGGSLVYGLSHPLEQRVELRRLRLSDGDDRLLMPVSGAFLRGLAPHPDGERFAFTMGEERREVWALERVTATLR